MTKNQSAEYVRAFTDWAYAAAMLNARKAAAYPIRLFVRERPGRKLFATRPVTAAQRRSLGAACRAVRHKVADWNSDFVVTTERHPVTDLLARPNPVQTGMEFSIMAWAYRQVFGAAYILVDNGDGDSPRSLWLLPSHNVEPILGDDMRDGIAGYHYAGKTGQVTFPADRVIQIREPGNLEHPFRGYGRMEAAWSAVRLKLGKREADDGLLENAVYPSIIFALKGATEAALARFETDVANKLQGRRKKGRIIGLNADAATAAVQSVPEVQVGDPEVLVSEIGAAFGVPDAILMPRSANLASAQAAEKMWLANTILPGLRLEEEMLNERLLPLFDGLDEDAFLAYDGLGDTLEDENRAVRLFDAGLITRDEARAMIGLGPGDDDAAAKAQ